MEVVATLLFACIPGALIGIITGRLWVVSVVSLAICGWAAYDAATYPESYADRDFWVLGISLLVVGVAAGGFLGVRLRRRLPLHRLTKRRSQS